MKFFFYFKVHFLIIVSAMVFLETPVLIAGDTDVSRTVHLIDSTITDLAIIPKDCNSDTLKAKGIKHVKVWSEKGGFGGWPANNGIWIWGNEILVGFVKANHLDTISHNYKINSARNTYARSIDGGETWSIEDAYKHGQKMKAYDNNILDKDVQTPSHLTVPINFNHPDLALTFLRQTNDTGSSFFYYSYNRGKRWNGAYSLPDLGTPGIAARTDYMVNGKNSLLAFVTAAKQKSKEGRVICIETNNGGLTWKLRSYIGSQEPDGFEIMPASIRLSATKILCIVRKRDKIHLLASYVSVDNGNSWNLRDEALAYTGAGGSPPALVKLKDGRLCLAYAFRSNEGSKMLVKFSEDNGVSWGKENILRQNDGANWDVGYPRMVQRPDGKLVLVYYWNHALSDKESRYRYIAATIFEPDNMK